MAVFLDNCKFNPTLGGTTDWVYSSAVPGYQSPAAANAQSGLTYCVYAASSDLSQWELSTGVNSGGTTFPRSTVLYNSAGTGTAAGQSGAGTKISFTAAPQVAVVALAEDLTVTHAAAKSDQQTASSAALAVTPSQQQSHPSAVKAWAYFTAVGSSYTLIAGYNVSGTLSRASAGVLTVTFTVPFATSAFAVTGSSDTISTNFSAFPASASTATIKLILSGTPVDEGFSIAVYGAQ